MGEAELHRGSVGFLLVEMTMLLLGRGVSRVGGVNR